MKTINALAACLLAGSLLSGCASQRTRPETAQAGSATLSAQDRSDIAEVLRLAKPGIPTPLDMTRPAHRRFFLRQLRAAGYTPERYPQIFRATEAASKAPPPAAAAMGASQAQGDQSIVTPIQTLTSVGTPDGTNYAASALSSVPDEPYFSQLIVQLYDSSSNPIGQPSSVTSATQPPSNLTTVANGVSQTSYAPVQGSATYFWQDQFGKPYHGVVAAVVTTAPTSITNLAPMPGAGQSITKLCLGRTGSDCTYTPVGGSGTNVLMPVQGSVSFASSISTVTSTQTSLITMAKPDIGQGGGCTIAATSNFFGDPNTHINGGTISWNLAPAQFAPAQGCLTPNSVAIYTLTLGLSVANQATFVTITSDTTTDPQNPYFKIIPQLQVFFSCLAEGSRVTLADGATVAVEDLVVGQAVRVDAGGRTMVVESKLKGMEKIPMVRLRTAKGRNLLITDGHPVMTPEGPVLAGLLQNGQTVMAQNGPDKLVSTERETFARPVWNLNLGAPPADLNDPDVKGSTFFAEGIQVGDNLMQFVENRRRQQEHARLRARRAPPEWQRDIQSAIEDRR
jgi:hypothetical protein